MKSFIRGILTIWLVILLIVLGVVSNMKSILIDTTDGIIKKELKTNIVKVVEEYSNEKIPDDVIQKVEKEIDSNKNIKKLMDNYYDKILDVLSNKEQKVNIDVAKELDALITDGEEVLKDYGITITQAEKEELLSQVSSSEINELVNESIMEIKSNMSGDVQMIIDIYAFLTSITFKAVLIILIAVALLFIALLHGSYYKWLSNFGLSTIFTGIIIGILLPMIIELVMANVTSENAFVISTGSLNVYGYVLIGIGIICYVVNFILKRKSKATNIIEEECV